jgi:hypothetical protein
VLVLHQYIMSSIKIKAHAMGAWASISIPHMKLAPCLAWPLAAVLKRAHTPAAAAL